MTIFDLINTNPVTCIIIAAIIGFTIMMVAAMVTISIDKYVKRRFPDEPIFKKDLPDHPDLNIH
jgi:hypothetical protein